MSARPRGERVVCTGDSRKARSARLLADAERVAARTRAQTDYRAHAVIQGWVAAALFVYVATFLLLFGTPAPIGSAAGTGPNYAYVNVLVVPFLTLTQIVQGARDRLPISVVLPHRRALLLTLPGLTLLLATAIASLVGIGYPWWANLLVAAAIAAPLSGLAISTARNASGTAPHERCASPLPPLSRIAAMMTAGLGICFGVIAASTAYFWFPAVTMFLTLALLVLLFGWSVPWGLPRVGSEWGQSQWVAFGVSFTLLFALVVLAAKTSWNTPLVATISGIAIAVPLVGSTLRTYRRQ
jgi:hypothetical protein